MLFGVCRLSQRRAFCLRVLQRVHAVRPLFLGFGFSLCSGAVAVGGGVIVGGARDDDAIVLRDNCYI
jgi:hypothetical protein